MVLTDEKPILDMVNAIVREMNPEKIIVFGSRAKGTAQPDSDVDLLIVENGSEERKRSRRKEMTHLWKLLVHFPISQDILIYSPQEIDQWKNTKNHVISRALREGKVIYERS